MKSSKMHVEVHYDAMLARKLFVGSRFARDTTYASFVYEDYLPMISYSLYLVSCENRSSY